MRRADRLFQIVQHLRGGRLVTARQLAQRLTVSERTIYRDIADLIRSGVPIEGEAGVGYLMRAGFELPPMMFTRDEVVALVAGARLIRAFGGAAMARASEEALVKIGAVLPEAERRRAEAVPIHAVSPDIADADRARLDALDTAIAARQTLTLDYEDRAGVRTRRDVRPLGLTFWGRVWTLVAWCELRRDARLFRVDRIASMTAGATFAAEPTPSLATVLAAMACDDHGPGPAPKQCADRAGPPAGALVTGLAPEQCADQGRPPAPAGALVTGPAPEQCADRAGPAAPAEALVI